MTSRLGLRLLALVVPALLVAPASAHAARVTVDDSVGDAKAVNLAVALGDLANGTSTDGPFLLDAPAETSSDVVRTTIDHARTRLTLTVQFRDLVEVAGSSAEFRISTPDGRYALVARGSASRTAADLYPIGRASGSTVAMSKDGSVTVTVGEGPKPCRTVRARYDLAADTLTASAPTSCLGSPKWVQVSAAASRDRITPLGDGSVNLASFADDAFRGGLSVRSLGRSPKVRRG